jgi:chromosome segregation ATPase
MPDIVRPGNSDPYAARDALRKALDAQREERERHDFLTAGQTKAEASLRDAATALANAQDDLTTTRRKRPAELAYGFAAGQELLQLRHSVAEAQALVTRRESEVQHYREILEALEREIAQVEVRLRNCQSAVHEALARVIATSTEFAAFCDELDHAWLRLRSLKVAADAIMVASHGHLPTDVYSKLQAAQPLEERVGYPVEDIVARWQGALARLLTSADTALPEGVS